MLRCWTPGPPRNNRQGRVHARRKKRHASRPRNAVPVMLLNTGSATAGRNGQSSGPKAVPTRRCRLSATSFRRQARQRSDDLPGNGPTVCPEGSGGLPGNGPTVCPERSYGQRDSGPTACPERSGRRRDDGPTVGATTVRQTARQRSGGAVERSNNGPAPGRAAALSEDADGPRANGDGGRMAAISWSLVVLDQYLLCAPGQRWPSGRWRQRSSRRSSRPPFRVD
jgi:hypothetical protein